MPEPSFWQYLSDQVPHEEVRTWPAECSLPVYHEVQTLLEPQGGVIPLYVYLLLFLCQTFPIWLARKLRAWWRGSEKPQGPTKDGGCSHTFNSWCQVILALWYAANVTYICVDITMQLTRCSPDVAVPGTVFYLLCAMPASELVRHATVGWMKSYLTYLMPSLEDVEERKAIHQSRVRTGLLCLTLVPMSLLLALFSVSAAVTCAACTFAFIGFGIMIIASIFFFGLQAAGLVCCHLAKPLTAFVKFGAKQTPAFLFCPVLVYYGLLVNLQKEFLAVAHGFEYNGGFRIADDELSRIGDFFDEARGFQLHWNPLQLPGLPAIHFESPSFDFTVPDLQRAHDISFLTILFVDPVLTCIAQGIDSACSRGWTQVAPEPKGTKVNVRVVQPRQQ